MGKSSRFNGFQLRVHSFASLGPPDSIDARKAAMNKATLTANGKRAIHQMHWEAIGTDGAGSGDVLARRERIVELALELPRTSPKERWASAAASASTIAALTKAGPRRPRGARATVVTFGVTNWTANPFLPGSTTTARTQSSNFATAADSRRSS